MKSDQSDCLCCSYFEHLGDTSLVASWALSFLSAAGGEAGGAGVGGRRDPQVFRQVRNKTEEEFE